MCVVEVSAGVGCRVSQLPASGVHSLPLLCGRQAAGQVPFAITPVSWVLRRSPLRFLLCGCWRSLGVHSLLLAVLAFQLS